MTTRIILLLDESSSMASDYARTISARDEIILNQKNIEIDGETNSPKDLIIIPFHGICLNQLNLNLLKM